MKLYRSIEIPARGGVEFVLYESHDSNENQPNLALNSISHYCVHIFTPLVQPGNSLGDMFKRRM